MVCAEASRKEFSRLSMSLQALKEGEKLQDNPDYYRCGCTSCLCSLQRFWMPHAHQQPCTAEC